MTRPTRKQRDDNRKRREILAAALEMFAEGGFHNTTMANISKAAQYPLGTIYKYFPGKKEMYHDLVIERVHELGRILYDIAHKKEMAVTEKLLAALKAQARFYRDNQDVVKIYISERSNIDSVGMPQLNERVNRLHERMVHLFEQMLEQGICNEEFKAYPARDMAELFADIVHSAAWSCLFREEDKDTSDHRLSMIFEMFTTGIKKQ
ncbi:MAG: TetR/AcrR family transcriptional regulator [Desulfotignum sp.]|jgi:AcrR family transcriptional regulator|nr:TetR/AcrR family transcriptional regulator [Desulfotignum sp.]